MTGHLKDLLLIQSLNLDSLIEDYRLFFLSLLPGMFVCAIIVEYFDRLNVFQLIKRAFVSVIILTAVTSVYKVTIEASIEAANDQLQRQKQANVLLYDLFNLNSSLLQAEKDSEKFYKSDDYVSKITNFVKKNLFVNFVNDGFTTVVYFISQLCIQLIKVIYSMVYYLGYGLIGVPCLIYLFPTMGNVLRGAVTSYIWCLIVPHILVFILTMIGSEIVRGYSTGQVIGGSATGSILLFVMTLLIAFTPLIAVMIVNGSGMAQAGGIIASVGANYILHLPKNVTNDFAKVSSGQNLGPKMTLVTKTADQSTKLIKNTLKRPAQFWRKKEQDEK